MATNENLFRRVSEGAATGMNRSGVAAYHRVVCEALVGEGVVVDVEAVTP